MRSAWICLLAACSAPHHAAPDAAATASVRIIAFNDFHGALESGVQGAPGAAYVASAIAAQRTPNTVVVSAGDLIGGTPLTSGLFHDEPTIDVWNAIGLDYNGVGNHEFDEGNAELQRMQHGGCHPVDGCGDHSSFAGASFQFLAANVRDASGQTIFPAYAIREVAGAKLAFVGVTLKDTPAETLASAIPELTFDDEVATVNALVPELQAAGADAIILLLHQGGGVAVPGDCTTLSGPIIDLANRIDPAVQWIASAHSHQIYNCAIGGHVVTSAGAHGSELTTVDLEIDLATHTTTLVSASNTPVVATGTPDPTIQAIVDTWVARAAPVGNRVIGTISADLANASTPAGENPMGDTIADAMVAATGAQAALMNAGGVRAPLLFAQTAPETVDGQVRYTEAYAVQPFQNNVLAVDLTGADLVAALDAWIGRSPRAPLEVAGITYTWHASAPHVTASDVTVTGSPVVATTTYRIAVNSIVASPVTTPSMANATNAVGYGVDLDLLTAYIAAHSPLAPPATGRISTTP